jgi:5'-nucleotidase
MPHFLLVNDDGAASPMLAPLAAALSRLGRVSIAVPAEEQSWKGSAVTRFGHIQVRRSEDFGVPAFVVGGTPADCVNLAIHHLLDAPPDWVVSGINIGSNAGMAYVLHSGTVAAAMQGVLQGVPSVAFSTYLPPEQFNEWATVRRLTHPDALHTIETTAVRTAALMARLLESGPPRREAVVNVNFPGPVTPETPVRWVPLHESRYGALFRPEGDGYVHAGRVTLHSDDDRTTDRSTILGGEISATLISLAGLGLPPPPAERCPF